MNLLGTTPLTSLKSAPCEAVAPRLNRYRRWSDHEHSGLEIKVPERQTQNTSQSFSQTLPRPSVASPRNQYKTKSRWSSRDMLRKPDHFPVLTKSQAIGGPHAGDYDIDDYVLDLEDFANLDESFAEELVSRIVTACANNVEIKAVVAGNPTGLVCDGDTCAADGETGFGFRATTSESTLSNLLLDCGMRRLFLLGPSVAHGELADTQSLLTSECLFPGEVSIDGILQGSRVFRMKDHRNHSLVPYTQKWHAFPWVRIPPNPIINESL